MNENVRSHHETLDRLSHNLKQLGMDDLEIDTHVTEILAEYEHELERTVRKLEIAIPAVFENACADKDGKRTQLWQ
ncbi:MAG: hypothetical protein ACR2PF_04530 [Rhizobiaceae bacterium]